MGGASWSLGAGTWNLENVNWKMEMEIEDIVVKLGDVIQSVGRSVASHQTARGSGSPTIYNGPQVFSELVEEVRRHRQEVGGSSCLMKGSGRFVTWWRK